MKLLDSYARGKREGPRLVRKSRICIKGKNKKKNKQKKGGGCVNVERESNKERQKQYLTSKGEDGRGQEKRGETQGTGMKSKKDRGRSALKRCKRGNGLFQIRPKLKHC